VGDPHCFIRSSQIVGGARAMNGLARSNSMNTKLAKTHRLLAAGNVAPLVEPCRATMTREERPTANHPLIESSP
jgi:hypothetical protein